MSRGDAYDRHRQRAAARQQRLSQAGRDIGAIPPVADPDRRAQAEASLERFCKLYLPEVFCLDWSDDHLRVIAKMEGVVLRSMMFAVAMPRGSGKTSLAMAAVLWAVLFGFHRYVVLIAANTSLAKKFLKNLKAVLESNERLLADFPEAMHAIRALEGEARRAAGQLHHGQKTHVKWGGEQIVFPTIPGSRSSGAVIEAKGILAGVRGLNHTTPDGEIIRPTLAVPDDPQTDKSAKSPAMTRSRVETIQGSVGGLAGSGHKMGIMIPCTVVQADDLAEQVLDHEKFPEYRGERTKMVYRWPDRDDLWDRYLEIRARQGQDEATTFYAEHRAEMDAGSEVAWPDNFVRGDQISAIQHAFDKRADMKGRFEPEYQNEPAGRDEQIEVSTAQDLAGRIVRVPRFQVPQRVEKVTAFIDVQKKFLPFVVAGFWPGLGGHGIDYGTWPDQKRKYFTRRDAKRSYAMELRGAGAKAQLYHALDQLTKELLERVYVRDDGTELRIERCLIDEGYMTDVVFQFCRESEHAARLMPSKGLPLRPQDIPIPDRQPKPGQQIGHHWMIQTPPRRALQHVAFDVNRWKSILFGGLRSPIGEADAVTVFQGTEHEHQLLFDHLTAEQPTLVTAKGADLEVFAVKPNRDNDLLDGFVGAMVAASTLGIDAVDQAVAAPKKKNRTNYRLSA